MALKTTTFLDASPYGFEWLRVLTELGLQEGVIGAGDFKTTAAAAGGLRVDVAAGTALVKGDSGTPTAGLSQGLYMQVNDAAIANAVTLTAAHATLPRIDQIILLINDSSDLGSASNTPTLTFVTGVATAGATLDNRTGAGALPANALRLADVLIPAAATATSAGNIRDRRPWARGATRRLLRNANAAAANDYITTSATPVVIDATNLSPRIECSGALMRLTLAGQVGSSVLNDTVTVEHRMDAAAIDGGAIANYAVPSAAFGYELDRTWTFTPPAGSHIFAPYFARGAGTGNATIYARAAIPLAFMVEELVRQNADNT